MNRLVPIAAIAITLLAGTSRLSTAAAELKLLAPAAMRSSMLEIIPLFERSSGQKVRADFGPAGALAQRVHAGEIADVAIVTDSQIDELQKVGKVLDRSKVPIARVGMGVFAPKGAGKVDIASLENFKRALLGAKSVGYNNPASGAPSGVIAAKLVSGLDIAPAIAPKVRLFPAGTGGIYQAVERGDIEIGLGQMTEIMEQPTVQFLGPLPPEIQSYTSFASGLLTASKQQDVAKVFIAFLTSPAAAAVMKAKGLEQVRRSN